MDVDIEYIKLQNEYRNLNANLTTIFPNEWYNIKEYELKKKILQECINNGIIIVQSSYYYQFKERALNSNE